MTCAPRLNTAPTQHQLHINIIIPSICIIPARTLAGCACSTSIGTVMGPTLVCRIQMLPSQLGIATRAHAGGCSRWRRYSSSAVGSGTAMALQS